MRVPALIDLPVVTTSDYTQLSAKINQYDAIPTGIYVLEYFAEMNPNLESRNHVNATVESRCIESIGEGVYSPVSCP